MFARLLAAMVVAAMSACGGGGGGGGETPPPAAADTRPPYTVASPAGGTYGSAPAVTLTADEAATIHYTTNGNEPVVGAADTRSGPSPVAGIAIGTGSTTVRFFAVDAAGNRETPVRSATYVVDAMLPTVSLVGPLPGPFGLLSTQDLVWKSDRAGEYVIESGVDGAAGGWTRIAQGVTGASETRAQPISGWQLSLAVRTPIRISVTDSLGRTGSTSALLTMKGMANLGDVAPSTSGDILILPGGRKAFVAGPGDAVLVFDIDPASPTYNTLLRRIDTGPQPYGLAAPDATRVYVTNMGRTVLDIDSIGFIDARTGSLTGTLALGANQAPGGIATTVDGTRAYFSTFTGELNVLDTAQGSPTFNRVIGSIGIPLLLDARIAMTPDGRRAIVNWTGSIAVAIQIVDVDPASPSYNTVIASPMPVVQGGGGDVAVSPDSRFAFSTESSGLCGLCKIDVQGGRIAAQAPDFVERLDITPDGEHLLTGRTRLTVYAAADLSRLGSVDPGGQVTAIAVTPDGTRAYVTRWRGSGSAELVMVPLR